MRGIEQGRQRIGPATVAGERQRADGLRERIDALQHDLTAAQAVASEAAIQAKEARAQAREAQDAAEELRQAVWGTAGEGASAPRLGRLAGAVKTRPARPPGPVRSELTK